MRVYISGKIGEEVISETTRQKFEKARKMLLSNGFGVVDPACEKYQRELEEYIKEKENEWDIAGMGKKFDRYSSILLFDLCILEQCEAIYMLRDWWDSNGARTEHDFAVATGKRFLYQSKVEAVEHAGTAWCHEFLRMPHDERVRCAHTDKLKRDFIKKKLEEIWLPTEP